MTGEPPAGGTVAGTLKWLASGDIADYWGAGNFVALAFEPRDEDAVVKVGIDGTELAELDESLDGVFKVTDPTTETFVVETSKDGETLRQVFDLAGLVLEPEPTPEPAELVATPSSLALAVGGTGDVVLSLSDGSPLDFTKLAWNTMPDASVATVTGGDPATGTVTFTAAGQGSTTAVLSYPNGPDTRSSATIDITVSEPAPPRLVFEPQEMTKPLGDNSGRVKLMLDGEPYTSTAHITYEPTGVFDLDVLAATTGNRDFSTQSVGSAIATATVNVDGETLTATFTGTVTAATVDP